MTEPNLLQEFGLWIHVVTQPVFFWFACMIGIGFLVYKKRYVESVLLTLSILTTSALVTLLKYSFAIARPDSALVSLDSYSFPSGHASTSATVAVLLIWLIFRLVKTARIRMVMTIVVISLASLVTLSRVLINVHTVLDVTVGALIGLCIPLFYIAVLTRSQKRTLPR